MTCTFNNEIYDFLSYIRYNDEVIRHTEEDEYYVDTDKQQENIEYDEPAQYQEKL